MVGQELHDAAVKLVHDNSGGIKFTELVTLLVSQNKDLERDGFVEELETSLRTSNVVKVLDYTFHQLNRSKMFIYTP